MFTQLFQLEVFGHGAGVADATKDRELGNIDWFKS